MMRTRVSAVALLSATAFAVSACGSSEEDNEPSMSSVTTVSSASESATTSSSAPSTTSSAKNAACDSDMELEDTLLNEVLEKEEAKIQGSSKKLTDVSIGEDAYDPCADLSYVILEGEYNGSQAAAPVFFGEGDLLDPTGVFLTADDVDVEETSDGLTVTAEETEDFVGVEMEFTVEAATKKIHLHRSFTGGEVDILYLDLGAGSMSGSSDSADGDDLGSDEKDLRGEDAFHVAISGLKIQCEIDGDEATLHCVRTDGKAWRPKGELTAMFDADEAFKGVEVQQKKDSFTVEPVDDESGSASSSTPKGKNVGEGLYRIGEGDFEGQLLVSDDAVMINASNKLRLILDADSFFLGVEDEAPETSRDA
ncbi:hypothetical protein [Corynebacterium sp.]|uniref:hypothetical protein n=1 Tax=Corynebacterium sp. TaxID=1720 RepID=UPI0026DBAC3A|nr:hypothetical protein [Corynebacterium sp.]MDO5032733.1 hypothetical protein [Corynebacterium sp.]